jgi:hypothetical protein
MRGSNPAARSIAYIILFIVFVASGLSLSAMMTGNRDLGLQICAGSIGVSIAVLIVGGFIAGASRPTEK